MNTSKRQSLYFYLNEIMQVLQCHKQLHLLKEKR